MIEAWEEEQMSNLGCESVSDLIAEVKRMRELFFFWFEQYTELREALVGDSPNWTHEELVEKALELIDNELEISKPVELEFGEWHSDMGEE
jgi:transposase-like protein